jgi:hypothetical protein
MRSPGTVPRPTRGSAGIAIAIPSRHAALRCGRFGIQRRLPHLGNEFWRVKDIPFSSSAACHPADSGAGSPSRRECARTREHRVPAKSKHFAQPAETSVGNIICPGKKKYLVRARPRKKLDPLGGHHGLRRKRSHYWERNLPVSVHTAVRGAGLPAC